MVDNSFAWAAANKKLRRNKVHGEEEARLVLEDWFDSTTEKGEQNTVSASGELEDFL